MNLSLDDLAYIANLLTRCIDGKYVIGEDVDELKAFRRKIKKAVLCKLEGKE